MKKRYNNIKSRYDKPVDKFNIPNAPICKHFGCSKILSPIEYLHSEYCFKHQQEINQKNINEIDKHISL